ncbi:MAG: hypothetical protein Q9170_003190 [Blastenia crenularia]
MTSANPSAQGQYQSKAQPSPGQLQTNDISTRSQRFSWQDTPLEVQGATSQQYSSPTNSTIDESPVSPRDGYQAFPSNHTQRARSVEKPPVGRTGSPYNLPSPVGTHPAHYAPVVETQQPQQREYGLSSSESKKTSEGPKSPAPSSRPLGTSHYYKDSATVIKPDTDQPTLVYNPSSLAGPNVAAENHRPGQVAHPNATIEPEWKHGLCEIDTLCCVGLCCPCIVYGKTQYRISRKTQKEDPTNMLGYESCNGSCGLMALACGFQCKSVCRRLDLKARLIMLPGVLASIQRARIRKLYHLNGDLGSDCLKSLCCCCCVIMQDEREVRDREETIRRHAGPASAAYTTSPTMKYAPPPR